MALKTLTLLLWFDNFNSIQTLYYVVYSHKKQGIVFLYLGPLGLEWELKGMHVQVFDAGAQGPVESQHNIFLIVFVDDFYGLILRF